MVGMKFPKRYLIVLLMFICTCVCYIKRVGFSIAYTVAADAQGVNQSTKGLILSAFFYGYAVSQVPGGWAAQRIGGRHVLLLSFVLWSLTCASVPLDHNPSSYFGDCPFTGWIGTRLHLFLNPHFPSSVGSTTWAITICFTYNLRHVTGCSHRHAYFAKLAEVQRPPVSISCRSNTRSHVVLSLVQMLLVTPRV